MVLHFAKAGDLPVTLNIGSFGQSGPPIGDPAAAPSNTPPSSGLSMDGMASMPGM
jgi:hypothetical protein